MPTDPDLIQQFQDILGERVRAQRARTRLTQLALAERIGVKRATLANVEVGGQRASAFLLAQLAQALHVPAEELIPSLAEAQAKLEESRRVLPDGGDLPKLVKRNLEDLGLAVERASTMQETLKAVGVGKTRRKQTAR